MKHWLRRNRVGLLLLPIALTVSVGAASSRINDYWWDHGMHGGQHPDSSGVVHYVDEYDDGFLTYPIKAGISLRSVEQVNTVPGYLGGDAVPVTVPTGGRLWKLSLHFDVDPSIVMSGCQVAVMGRDGSRFESNNSDFDTTGQRPIHLCAPDDTPGPQTKIGSADPPKLEPGEDPRPREYDTTVYVVTTAKAVPSSVRVWFYTPTFAEFPVEQR